jgi:hypothetical protein
VDEGDIAEHAVRASSNDGSKFPSDVSVFVGARACGPAGSFLVSAIAAAPPVLCEDVQCVVTAALNQASEPQCMSNVVP